MATNDAIGTSLYIDYSDFASGIAEANRLIKLNEQQFKTSAEGLDDWAKTSEGLEKKLNSLSNILQIQRGKVSAMEKEYEKIKNQYGENSAQAQKYALKLEKEKTTLAKTEKEQRKYNKALEEVKQASDKAKDGIEEVTDALEDNAKASDEAKDGSEKASSGFKDLLSANLVSSAITGLVSSLTGLVGSLFSVAEATKEYRMNMAKVEQTALSMGESFSNAKENMLDMASVSGDLEASGEAINNLLASGIKGDNLDKITEQLTGASIKWKDTLKLEGLADGLQETLATNNAIGPFAELLERGGQNLEAFNGQLKNCKTEAEKQNLVMTTLSKMGLEDITKGYYEANKSMIDNEKATLRYNDTMAQLGDAMQPINTILTNLKTNLVQSFLPSIKTIAQGFTELANGVSGATNKIASGFVSVLKTVGQRIATIGQQIISSAIRIVPDLLSKLSQALPLVVSLIGDYLNLALLTMTEKSGEFTSGFGSLFGGLIDSAKNVFASLLELLPSLIQNIFSFLSSQAENIGVMGKNMFSKLVDGLSFAIDKLKENLPLILQAIASGLSSFLSLIHI